MNVGWFPGAFQPEYAVELSPEMFVTDTPVHHFPAGEDSEAADSERAVVARFIPEGMDPWIGHFVSSTDPTAGESGSVGVFATPDPLKAVVVTGDIAYLVDVRIQEASRLPLQVPVRALTAPGLLLLSDPRQVVAIGPSGIEWAIEVSAYGPFQVVDATSDWVTCRVRDPDVGEWNLSFAADTGEILDRERIPDPRPLASRFSSDRGVSIETVSPVGLPGVLLDVDITPMGRWVGIAERQGGRVLVREDGIVPCQVEPAHPRLRAIDETRVLVIGSGSSWILSATGEVERSVEVGGDVEEVIASESYIVAAFGDQGGYNGEPYPLDKALAVLDGEGNFLFAYYDQFVEQAVNAYDVYTACWNSEHTISFLPYPEFVLVRLNLSPPEQEVVPLPPELKGSSAMTAAGPDVFFHRAYHRKQVIWRWRPEVGQQPVAIAEFDGMLRGLRDGRFIAVEGKEFGIVTCPTG